ncbi:hypothetical protein CBR_g19241 [Chara braunii]|uniref:Uncharacterized protein n=1 Tax=Chara braunii TaxID=69332 RepID=A0A388JTP9_CHABU|nr:hypothetical protein CBR_g19241 [Chara braunii]|eukprot:GBG61165.1 hypothetical protein CBR_g19241 [Chara braunii]
MKMWRVHLAILQQPEDVRSHFAHFESGVAMPIISLRVVCLKERSLQCVCSMIARCLMASFQSVSGPEERGAGGVQLDHKGLATPLSK